MSRKALTLSALLIASFSANAFAFSRADIEQFFDRLFHSRKAAMKTLVPASADSLGIMKQAYHIPLGGKLNRYLKNEATFQTAEGKTVYLTLTRAVNCSNGAETCKGKDRLFAVLATSDGKTFPAHAFSITSVPPVKKGKIELDLDGTGKLYTVKIKLTRLTDSPKFSDVKLVVDYDGKTVYSATAAKILDGMMPSVDRVTMGNYDYIMMYGNPLVQNAKHVGRIEQNNPVVTFLPLSSDPAILQFPLADLANGPVAFSEQAGYIFTGNEKAVDIFRD